MPSENSFILIEEKPKFEIINKLKNKDKNEKC